MARLAGIHANSLGANFIYLGVMELESANSGYRDCSRAYMDGLENEWHVYGIEWKEDDFNGMDRIYFTIDGEQKAMSKAQYAHHRRAGSPSGWVRSEF